MAILEQDIFIIDPSHQTLRSNAKTVRSKLQSSYHYPEKLTHFMVSNSAEI
jgi:hypothetical protein